MKKKIAVFFLISTLSLGTFAQITVGASAGSNYTLDDLSDLKDEGYKIDQTGNLFTGEVGYRLPHLVSIGKIGQVALVTGIRAGTLHVLSTEKKDKTTDFELSTKPLYGFARIQKKYVYADLGLGIHFWNLKYSVDSQNLDNTDTDFSLYLSMGGVYTLFDRITFLAGPTLSYFSIPDLGNKTSGNSLSAGAAISLALSF